MNHLVVRSAMKRGVAGGNFRHYFAVAPGMTPKFGASAVKVSGVEVEKLGGLLVGRRRMMSSAAEPTASSPPSVEKATKSESGKKEAEKGDLVVSSYWGVSRPKIKRADGSDWPWNCFMPWETYAADLSIDLHKHHVPKGFLDKVAYRTVKLLRIPTDIFFQAVLKQFGAYGGSDNLAANDAELQQHQKLEKLYISTRAAKHFQRDIVRGVEGYIVTGSKQVEIGTKLSEDGRKYGAENTCTTGNTLSKAASNFSRARAQMEKEHGNLLKALGTQVAEPLRAMVMGAPLEDARHLAQRYDRMRQEAEVQAVEVARRQAKVREGTAHPDMILKLEGAEVKLQDLKSNVATLGKEAAAAMAAVEAQQQRLTLQRLIAMVEAERAYHQRVLQILDQLEGEMMSERQRIEAAPSPSMDSNSAPPTYEEVNGVSTSPIQNGAFDTMSYFLGEVMYSYQAESDTELNLSTGDYIVVRKVSNNGWAEGECKGKAGWFPLGYIERRDRVLASKVAEVY